MMYSANINDRNIRIDIFKIVLMYFVVCAHADKTNSEISRYIYWFHMPAFFMLSGYLTTFDKYSFKDFVFKRFKTYIIPYISFSILFYILFQPENFLKNMVRTVWGGVNNTLTYSYPYWFINCLFISILLYKLMSIYYSKYIIGIIALLMWIIVHVFREYIVIYQNYFPWGIDTMFLAFLFVTIGNIAGGGKYQEIFVGISIFSNRDFINR